MHWRCDMLGMNPAGRGGGAAVGGHALYSTAAAALLLQAATGAPAPLPPQLLSLLLLLPCAAPSDRRQTASEPALRGYTARRQSSSPHPGPSREPSPTHTHTHTPYGSSRQRGLRPLPCRCCRPAAPPPAPPGLCRCQHPEPPHPAAAPPAAPAGRPGAGGRCCRRRSLVPCTRGARGGLGVKRGEAANGRHQCIPGWLDSWRF